MACNLDRVTDWIKIVSWTTLILMEMLYKTCGGTNVARSGFEEKRDTAFSMIESGVMNGHGFYTGNYQSVYMLGQCEGDVGDSDRGECMKSSFQKARVECGSAISGQVYLHKCFISYSYYLNGVPQRQTSSPSSSSSSSSYSSGGGGGGGTRKKFDFLLGGPVTLRPRTNV